MVHVRMLLMAIVIMANVVLVHLTTQSARSETFINDQDSDEVTLLQSHLQTHKRNGAVKDSASKESDLEHRRQEALHSLFGVPSEFAPRVAAGLENMVQKLPLNASSGYPVSAAALPATIQIPSSLFSTSHRQTNVMHRSASSRRPWFKTWGIHFLDKYWALKGIIVSILLMGIIVLGVIICGSIIGAGAPSPGDDDDTTGVPSEGFVEPEIYATFSARKRQHLFLSVPSSTLAASVWSFFMNITIVLSLVTMFLDSFRDFAENHGDVIAMFEWFYLFVFFGEWIGRIMCCSSIPAHFCRVMTFIDFGAAFPSLLECVYSDEDVGKEYNIAKILRVLRILRLFRLFKLLSKSKQMHIIVNGLMASVPAFIGSISIIAFAIVVPGVLMYYIEQGDWDESLQCYRRTLPSGELEDGCSPFQNMGASFYWAVTTVSTVGYGDITPVTSLGKTCCSFIMILCIVLMSFPIAMITSAFTLALDEYEFESVEGFTSGTNRNLKEGVSVKGFPSI
mmetsp:Transcript_27305/g.50138  ORF Transcript_27305/g.50138 Transcript_27305/m.50138 type:complete len:508 (+) Transcript_27305:41-1564(+)